MKKTSLIIAMAIALGGCQNPFDKAKDDVKQAQKLKSDFTALSTYLSNSPLTAFATAGYSEAWITLYKVEAKNITKGSNIVLFEDAAGKSVNVTTRDGMAELLTLSNVDIGSYDSLIVTIGSTVTLVANDVDGTTVSISAGSDPTYDITVPLNLTLVTNVASEFALRFDLASFIPTAQNLVAPVIEVVTNTATFQRLYGQLKGTISSVDLVGKTITVILADGSVVVVTVPSFASMVNETNKALLVLADLKIGDIIQFFGNYNGNELRLELLSLIVNPKATDQGKQGALCSSSLVEVEGFITAHDVINNTYTLDLEEASFLPSSDTINVINMASATYTRGTASMVSVNQKVEIRGSWDCSDLDASIVEVEDAPSTYSLISSGYNGELAEAKGTYTLSTSTLNVTEHEHFTLPGSTIALDLTNAWYKEGNSSCLVDNANIEVKGTVNDPATLMTVSRIEIESCSTGTLPDEDGESSGTDSDD
ncbi:MAG: hypothetical protein OEM38_09650 [Gammaproteobacteria bacterium]|nr:hypothetical protein [Gammaproteobacteria bacterium]